jgi:type IV pilus assembly protein PilN
MIRINLLPHREIKRKRQQKEFFIMLGAVVGLGAAIWFAVHSYLGGQLEEQNGRNTYLESEIAILEKQIDEIKKLKEQTAALLQRKKVVESLQANRAETVYLLDQLVRQLPDGVYLKSVQQKAARVTVGGFAQSNARVSTFMRNLESSPYLEKPVLIEIKAIADKTTRLSEFSLSVLLTRNKDDQTPARKPAAKPVAGAREAVPTARVVATTAPGMSPVRTNLTASPRAGSIPAAATGGTPAASVAESGVTGLRR